MRLPNWCGITCHRCCESLAIINALSMLCALQCEMIISTLDKDIDFVKDQIVTSEVPSTHFRGSCALFHISDRSIWRAFTITTFARGRQPKQPESTHKKKHKSS